MAVDETQKVTQFLQFQMFTSMLKQQTKDIPNFDIMLEALTKAFYDGDEIFKGVDLKNISISKEKVDALGKDAAYKINNAYKDINKDVNTGNIAIDQAIKRAASKYGVDADFIKSVIKQESGFNPNSKSWAGAMGLMQIMPENCGAYGITDPYDINQNVDGGTKLLKDMLDRYAGSKELALSAYNGGPTRMMRRGVNSVGDIYKMPEETRNYVKKVMDYYKESK